MLNPGLTEKSIGLNGEYINPATSDNQTNGQQKTMIFDSWGDTVGSTMIDQLMVSESHRLSGGVFNGSTPDTNFFISSESNGATVSILNGTIDLATSTTSGSSIKAHAQSLARYVGSAMNSFRTITRFGDIGTTNNTRQLGVINGNGYGVISNFTDGFFFQLSGTTFSVVSRTNNVDVVVNSGSFNGDVASWVVDTNYHTFEILYTNKRIEFYIDRVLIHKITQTDSRICSTRHFKPFGSNFNTGVGSVCHLYSDVITISQFGTLSSQAKTYFQQGTTTGVQLKVGSGSLHRIVISGVTNNSVITLYDGTATTDRVIWSSGAMTNQTVPFGIDLDGAGGTPFEVGLFLSITVAASNAFIKYE